MISFLDFTKRLARGQLKNTSAVSELDKNSIDDNSINTILDLTNQGLVDLSSRFPILTRQVDLIFQPNINIYLLNSSGLGSYLSDTDTEDFEDNFIKVLDIFDSEGKSHTFDSCGHIMTPTYNTLRFSNSKIKELGEKVRIRYQAKHPMIDEDDAIDIPPNLETALQLFVSSLFLSHMNSKEHTDKGDSYFAAYLRHIGEDEIHNNSSISEIDVDNRFSERGFV